MAQANESGRAVDAASLSGPLRRLLNAADEVKQLVATQLAVRGEVAAVERTQSPSTELVCTVCKGKAKELRSFDADALCDGCIRTRVVQFADMTRALASVTYERDTFRASRRNLAAGNADLRASVETLKRDREARDATIVDVGRERDRAVAARDESEAMLIEIAKLVERVDGKETTLDAVRRYVLAFAALAGQIAGAGPIAREREIAIADGHAARSELASARARVAELEAELAVSKEARRTLAIELRKPLATRIAAVTGERDGYAAQLVDARRRIAELEAATIAVRDRLSAIAARVGP